MDWDGEVYYQSQHTGEYAEYLAYLNQLGLTYRCECSRKTLAQHALIESENGQGAVYLGTCRDKLIPEAIPHSLRVKVNRGELSFSDSLQGPISRKLRSDDGDFILKRRDGIIAYQFAVVVDDFRQGVNHIVRGCDLLSETPKQIYLQQCLGFQTPTYSHVPVIVDQHGDKLSKQTLATAVSIEKSANTLFELLVLLRQKPPTELDGISVSELLAWAIKNWQADALCIYPTISV